MPDNSAKKKPEMHRNEEKIPLSAMYTAATWHWAKLPCSDLTLPEDSEGVFRIVNAYMKFYRWINPKMDLLQHMLLRRHSAINYLLKGDGYNQIVELASGFSPRGSWLSENPKIDYFEIDLPEVINKKRQLLSRHYRGQLVLGRNNFHLLEGDITRLNLNALPMLATAIVAEGIMMYFDRNQQLMIWRSIAESLATRGGELLFDYIPPALNRPRSKLGQLLHNLKIRLFGENSPYRYDHRTAENIMDDLRSAGFHTVNIHDGDTVAKSWRLPYGNEPAKVLIFQARVAIRKSEKIENSQNLESEQRMSA